MTHTQRRVKQDETPLFKPSYWNLHSPRKCTPSRLNLTEGRSQEVGKGKESPGGSVKKETPLFGTVFENSRPSSGHRGRPSDLEGT